jgi:D-glycero-D-manno-heptose 1,7-bisphosphate phosphatase
MKLVILDRDGVVNEDSDEYIKSAEEWIPIAGSPQAIARLNRAGFHVLVATNQSGIGRGYFDIETLARMHDKMHRIVREAGGQIDGVVYCPHTPEDNCDCRKPKPGMLEEISQRLGHDLSETFIVGDSLRDLEAAQAVGAKPVLVRTGKGQKTVDEHGRKLKDIPVFDDLASFVEDLLTPEASSEDKL